MKKLFIYSCLSVVFLLNSGAGCNSKDEDPKPEEFKLLVNGLWEVTKTVTKEEGDIITLRPNKGALGFRFYADGTLESCAQGQCAKLGRWSFKLQNETVGDGRLTFYLENAGQREVFGDQLEGHLEINTDNDIIWVIKGNPLIGNTDAYEMQWTMVRSL
jgi:hypothetical protein